MGSARSLKDLWAYGGRACEYFFRPFANPAEEVSWRTGATARRLADWFDRGERAYFSRSNVKVGDASLSLEPLVWKENPSVSGPPQYVRDNLTVIGKMDYIRDLKKLKSELAGMDIPNREAVTRTLACIDGTINECEQLLK